MLIRQKYNSFATSPIFPSWRPYLLAKGNDPTPSPPPSLNLALGEMWYLFGGNTLASARLLLSTATASAKRRRTVVRYSRHSFSMPAIWPGLEIAFTPLNRSLLSCYDTYSFFLSRNQFCAFTVRLSHYRCKPIAVLLNVFFLSFHSHFQIFSFHFNPVQSTWEAGVLTLSLSGPTSSSRTPTEAAEPAVTYDAREVWCICRSGARALGMAGGRGWVEWLQGRHGSSAIFRSGSSDAIDSKLINASVYTGMH